MLHAKDIPVNGMNYLRLLRAVSQPQNDVREIELIIKQEASVCYRLLRYLNSAAFGIQNEVHSIRHALTLLGGTRGPTLESPGRHSYGWRKAIE